MDYSNTIIYQIRCKDEAVKDLYVGHTTNFIQRKMSHKIACNNLQNQLKVYNVIRSNGGWDNWTMTEIAKYNCQNATEARIKEQQHYEALNATLNSRPPYVNNTTYNCMTCSLEDLTYKQYQLHLHCAQKMVNVEITEASTNFQENIKSPDSSLKVNYRFPCEVCNYFTNKKSSFDKHLKTNIHGKLTKVDNISSNNCNKVDVWFTCDCCNKNFRSRVGLWKHKKSCNPQKEKEVKKPTDKEVICMLIEQNSMLIKEHLAVQNLLLDIVRNGVRNGL